MQVPSKEPRPSGIGERVATTELHLYAALPEKKRLISPAHEPAAYGTPRRSSGVPHAGGDRLRCCGAIKRLPSAARLSAYRGPAFVAALAFKHEK